jgi:1,4-dihydroxy-2-naphthoate octaprenyltransferase
VASLAQWVAGARPRTLPTSVAPVLAGWGAAEASGTAHWLRAWLAGLVALALQVGVNYANDYSDGVRGTDAARVGPLRLVGSGVAAPAAVRAAALISFAVAGLAGLVLVALTGRWWLLALGAVCVAAAWCYTGGPRPYGYAGFGELAVFVFFGLVAVLGTQYVVGEQITALGGWLALAVGSLSAAVLVVNNLRDLPTDAVAAKRTLAVLLGDRHTRTLYTVLVAVPFGVTLGLASTRWAILAGLLALPCVVAALRRVRRGGRGMALIPALRDTVLALLVWAAATAAALTW